MMGSLARIALVTRTLMRQNRVLLGLLLLWPCVISGILLIASRGAPAVDDAAAALEQELFYGLVLAGLGTSMALGTEQRARRTQQILGRAVSRTEYLLALGASTYLPFIAYVLVWAGNAGFFAGALHLHTPLLLASLVAELSAGLLLCAVGLLCSVLFPQLLAAALTGVALAALTGAGIRGFDGVPRLFAVAVGQAAPAASMAGAAAWSILAAVASTAVGALVWSRKDVRLF